jgi:hypothetical protein
MFIIKNVFRVIKIISKVQIFCYKIKKNMGKPYNISQLLTHVYKPNSPEHITVNENEYFYIYSESPISDDNKCINKKVSKIYQEIEEYDLSTFEFISIDLNIDKKSYKIKLKTDLYNFYIVDNILDKNFFVWYLITHYNLKAVDIIHQQMYLKIIDNNVNEIEIDISKEMIQILKNNFIIVCI